MNSTSIKLLLPNDIIGGAMDFANESQADTAILNTLTAFVNLMKARGKVPERTPAEYDFMVKAATRIDDNADMFEDIDSFLPEKASPAAIAAEVERRIQSTATPNISQPVGDIGESHPIERDRVNLYEVDRTLTLDKLKKMAPKDRLIELAVQIERDVSLGMPVDELQKLIIPAIEIVYSSILQADWGSPHAEKKISSLIQMHGNPVD
jgi:hypothetical protein